VFFVYEEVIREEARQFADVPDCDDGGAGGGGGAVPVRQQSALRHACAQRQ